MENIDQIFQEKLNIQISDDFLYDAELYIYSVYTADGYNVYVISETNDFSNVNPENDLYYYQPSFDDVMKAIDDLRYADDDEPIKVYCDDLEEYFPEYEMKDYLYENDYLDPDED